MKTAPEIIKKLVILADGDFPVHPEPLEKLKSADIIVCCDGAVMNLAGKGITPDAIVGDMDTLDSKLQSKYSSIIHKFPDQESNDLTKAFLYSLTLRPSSVAILGATGKREDHTVGNISLLAEYVCRTDIPVEIYTDYGKFIALKKSSSVCVAAGTQISVFAFGENICVESEGLKYPLKDVVFDSWWKGTLNESSSGTISLKFGHGTLVLFIAYQKQ
jgi:thiamine pyrophosphokinase